MFLGIYIYLTIQSIDPLNISLMDAFIPPIWSEGGDVRFILGTDQQGRDMLSTSVYGSRISKELFLRVQENFSVTIGN